MEWEVVIGLEVHVQLATKTKMFSNAPTTYGAKPNTQACAIDLGLPGVLPILNKKAVKMAIKFGLAIDAKLTDRSVFERKNYFYPDLPKGYQISQFKTPIVGAGQLNIRLKDGGKKIIGITRAHLEEDAGKSLHRYFKDRTGIDLNRAGIPLLEIVSEPDMRSAKEAVAYMKEIYSLVCYLEICDGNMQEGSFRCDTNVSIRLMGEINLGTRVELKNINSFRNVERAINIEFKRQIEIIEKGGKVLQETRLYDDNRNITLVMRKKEETQDYRYFPDPDLLPLVLKKEMIEQIRITLPELPNARRDRFIHDMNLSFYDASVLTSCHKLADYYEVVLMQTNGQDPKMCANWICDELLGTLNKFNLDIATSPITAKQLGEILVRIIDNTISGKIAKLIFESLWKIEANNADSIIKSNSLEQITDSMAIKKMIDEVIFDNIRPLEQYLGGKKQLFDFFVGQVMRISKGKANPVKVNNLLKERLMINIALLNLEP